MMQWGDLLDGELFESRFGARWSPTGDAAATDLDASHQSYHNDGNISPSNPLASVQAAVTRRSNAKPNPANTDWRPDTSTGPNSRCPCTWP